MELVNGEVGETNSEPEREEEEPEADTETGNRRKGKKQPSPLLNLRPTFTNWKQYFLNLLMLQSSNRPTQSSDNINK